MSSRAAASGSFRGRLYFVFQTFALLVDLRSLMWIPGSLVLQMQWVWVEVMECRFRRRWAMHWGSISI